MAGFSISLKNKVAKKPGVRKNAFSNDVVEKTRTEIDGFSKLGAMQGHQSLAQKNTLVIVPIQASSTLPKRETPQKEEKSNVEIEPPKSDKSLNEKSLNAQSETEQSELAEKATQSLLSDFDTGNMIIKNKESDAEKRSRHDQEQVSVADYEAVPVDQFGAALLRGMGWDGRFEKTEPIAPRRKLGAVLGIGAKPLDKDLEPELTKKNISAPLKRK